ncbi:DUF1499 domain-containing protein [Usitatibacter palustris]|uniref:DUF1499 domain-containing protein n=1 Tax=Usitatibacter palustris TaxID=2732487 RepID=A0A6M4H9J2_9PROT|nr:DUF1499 domain-containing protein [Usitatibacter palustris]QJR16231.1 hypothetical protein DSM104440_03060 [Usitatibacter palustris]
MRWVRRVLVVLAALGATLAVVAIVGAQMGLFSGSRPDNLGLREGKLRNGDWRPNWVSSQAASGDKHFIAPLRVAGAAPAVWAKLESVVRAMPGATVVTSRPDYLHVEFSSKTMGFVDDTEFTPDPAGGAIHVRSGARLGVRDFDVNRKRVEGLREALSR